MENGLKRDKIEGRGISKWIIVVVRVRDDGRKGWVLEIFKKRNLWNLEKDWINRMRRKELRIVLVYVGLLDRL